MHLRPVLLALVAELATVLASGRVAAQASEAPAGADAVELHRGERPRADEFETARMVGTGLGLRAGAFGTTAVLVNPANLPLARSYHVEGFVQYIPVEGGVSFGSVIADSSTQRIRAGVASRAIFGDGEHDYRGSDQRLALGTALSDAIGLGVSLRYMRFRARDQTSDGFPSSLELRRITLDAAVRVSPFEGLHIAALGYNLVRTKSVLAPTQIGGSVVYQLRSVLQVGGDFLVDLTTFDHTTVLYGGAVEWWIAERYPLRAGYRRDEGRKIHALSFGVGFVEQRYGIELSLRQELGPYRQSVILVSARYALDVQQE